jgi:gluconokinase
MYVIGLDLGTTSTKAVLFDFQGTVVHEAAVEYPLDTPHPGWAEQDPEKILQAAEHVIADLISHAGTSEVVGIGLSSAMHSLILMDENHNPLTQNIIWADNRSVEQAEHLRSTGTGRKIYLQTGTPIHPMSPLSKIIWFREHQPELFNKTAKFISIKEYILYRWFNEYITDYSIASATGLFNLQELNYDRLATEVAGITTDQLSTPVPTTHILRGMEDKSVQKMGISKDLPIIIGASDGCLANLGIGALSKGEIAITIGTSGAIRTVVPRPLTDDRQRTFCYALSANHWVVGGPSNNGGILFRWFRDQFTERKNYEQLTAEAATVSAGSGGLLCLPYVSGERAPIWNAEARGCFFGMALHHERKHFVRAVLEGIVFNLFGIGKAVQELSGDFTTLTASGGFVRSSLWCQILSDVFGAEVVVPENPQSSSWGAAILVLLALDKIADIEHFKDSIHVGNKYVPNMDAHQTYRQLYQLYEEVYLSLMGPFERIARYQTK